MKGSQLKAFGIKLVSFDTVSAGKSDGKVFLWEALDSGVDINDCDITSFTNRMSLAHPLTNGSCPVILSGGRVSVKKALSCDVDWGADSALRPYWKPDLEACNSALIGALTEGGQP